TSGRYLIYMFGFAPGFPYLGGLDPRLHTPRLDTPRDRVEAGSVGIANNQTGIYPIASPGGWQIIGRTPLRLFIPEQADPVPLYRPGDQLRFVSISETEFHRLAREENHG
ncbi:MAG: 5-oxoprolinase subunit B family protein, partial [Desulfovermiculus sp.]